MLKRLKSVSMMLFLMGASSGAAYAVSNPSVTDVKITQQNGACTGIVKDATGEAIIGASVVVKGTTNGTITGLDGDFSISNVKNGDVIVISFVGYTTQEIKFAGKSLDVTLKDDTQLLGEVVVTALGMKREEKALGYAVTEVRGDELKAANTISPVAALQGKVAGVEIAQSDGGIFGATKIQIRGASTLSGNNQPIYVIDGVILDNGTSGNTTMDWGQGGGNNANDYGNELKNLNPDDFETVSILKGAAATALYGSRGLNGAVVITTKGGKGAKGFGVSVSQTFGVDWAYKTPYIQTEYGPGNRLGRSDADLDGTAWDADQFTVNGTGENTLIGSGNSGWGPRYDGSQIRNYDGTWTTYSPHKNNMLDMYRLGFNTNTNVSVRGGSEKTSFYSSLSYKKAKSTTMNNDFERYSMMAKVTHQISDRVDIGASITFANSTPRNAQLNVGERFVDPNSTVWTPMYDSKYFRDKYAGEHGGLASTSYGDLYGSVPNKDYWFKMDNYDYYQKESVFRPQMEINVKIADWVKFKADANMNYYYTRGEDKQLGSGYANEGGYYATWQNTKEQTTFGGTFTFNKAINDFFVGGFARFEYYNSYQNNHKVYTDGGMVVPGQWFVDNSKKPKKSEAGISNTKRMLSAIFAVNLGWKNQLYLDITGRNDWSSALVYSTAAGNYSYFYPSISGSWLINETFKESMPSWVNLAKIRGSWAQVGNDTDAYKINQAYGFGSMEMSDGNIYTNTLSDLTKAKDLKPERKTSWEIGIDFRTFNNRLNLDATYYKENTRNQIMEIGIPDIAGTSRQLVNAGNIQNSGIEIALNTIPFKNKDWEWSLDFTYTKNSSKIVSLHPNVANFINLSGYPTGYDYQIGSVAKVGGSYGILMSNAKPAYNEKGELLLEWWDAGRGAAPAQSGTVEEVGSMQPDFLGSISTGLTYKNWSLHVGLDMRFGGYVASYCNLYGTGAGWTKTSMKYRDEASGGMTFTSQYANSKGITYHDGMVLDGVFKDGTKATFVDGTLNDVSGMSYKQLVAEGKLEPMHAANYYANAFSWGSQTINDDWVTKLNYIALRDITVSYRFSKAIAHKIGAQNMNVSASARNIGYLYNSLPNNLNPETVRGNTASEFRIRGYEPYTMNLMMTINLEF